MYTAYHETYRELVTADEVEAVLAGRTRPEAVGAEPRVLAVVAEELHGAPLAPALEAGRRQRIRARVARKAAAARAARRFRLADALYRYSRRPVVRLRAGVASGLAAVLALLFASGVVVGEAAAF